ncbi:MAG: hypothetical protein Q9195_007973, partial [Heterodermia aff. obscurata]
EIVHTYLIETPSSNSNTTNWKKAAIEINHLFLNAGVAQDDIEVEIINPSLAIHQISTALPNDPMILAALEGQRSKVVNFLQSHAPSHWTSVAFHMRHHKLRPNEPKRPTILVFFRIGSVSRYETLEQKLAEELKSAPIPLALEFLSGEIDLCTRGPPQIPRAPMGLNPRNGASIGRRGDDTEAGTLGGWLMLKYPDNKLIECAMTCFQVIAGQNILDSSVLGTKAVEASFSKNLIQVEYPAASDRKFAIQSYRTHLQSKLNPQQLVHCQKELDRLEQCDRSPVIGTVIYSSGVRTNQANRRMDWALIETPRTYRANLPSPASMFPTDQSRCTQHSSIPIPYATDAGSQVRAIGNIGLSDWVVKSGRTSAETSGQVNRLSREVKWEGYNNFITQEREVLGLSGDFAQPGDSGAFVTNADFELLGMVIGRDANASDYGVGLVTDIRDIEQDVKAMCRAIFALPS